MMSEMICILCPRDCHLKIDEAGNVSGNFCKRGVIYANSERTNPVRSLSSKMRVLDGKERYVSVKTSEGVLKDKQLELNMYLKTIEVSAPVVMGQVIVKNPLDLKLNIIATRNVKKVHEM